MLPALPCRRFLRRSSRSLLHEASLAPLARPRCASGRPRSRSRPTSADRLALAYRNTAPGPALSYSRRCRRPSDCACGPASEARTAAVRGPSAPGRSRRTRPRGRPGRGPLSRSFVRSIGSRASVQVQYSCVVGGVVVAGAVGENQRCTPTASEPRTRVAPRMEPCITRLFIKIPVVGKPCEHSSTSSPPFTAPRRRWRPLDGRTVSHGARGAPAAAVRGWW